MNISIFGTGNMASGLAVLFAEARRSVVALATSAGFAAVEADGLASARCLDPVAGLNIAPGYGIGHGTDIAPAWQGIA